MAWEHLSINRPHLVYIILGGFTSIFMLCSSIIKERLYIGEATVATICGIIFGPLAADLINPLDWGNTDQITLEFARIILVVQCFAVGVELPKYYMERHWKSVTLLLVPVMAFGWLMTSLFIWWLFRDRLNWLDSLVVAACVTATDPVLASSVVGKGKFAKRVPKHLRDLLSAESGCNDGMAFPFVYLGIYLIRYHLDAGHVTYHWICYTILYECLFGAVYGVIIGYTARRAIRYAHEHDLIDRESFLVFYFVLALFCAGSGSLLGLDDLLVGFACGVGFSNDGWFQEKTEEAHVSNVIDLLLNLAFFVYFGTIIPWNQFNSDILGIHPWQLVVLAIFVLLFRRIPVMLMLKPIISDLKTWREALFAGHFGPIGVGAIFVAILARAEFETDETTPLAVLPEAGFPHLNIIEVIWPIVTFLVLCSIIVHGSSVAVFTLGKHINTLTLSFSYTTAVEDGPSWMERLPRIQSRSKSSMSQGRFGEGMDSELSLDEKPGEPISIPKNFLRRQREEDNGSRSSSRIGARRRRKWDNGIGPGGPIHQSAIMPRSRLRPDNESGDLAEQVPSSENEKGTPESPESPESPKEEIYEEGNDMVIEDEDGNVLEVRRSRPEESEDERRRKARRDARELLNQQSRRDSEGDEVAKQDSHESRNADRDLEKGRPPEPKAERPSGWRKRMESFSAASRRGSEAVVRRGSEADPGVSRAEQRARTHGPARAYTFGNTVIVEDEDGEVIKTYQIPSRPRPEGRQTFTESVGLGKNSLFSRVGSYFTSKDIEAAESSNKPAETSASPMETAPTEDDDNIRFKLTAGGPRLKKSQFINELTKLDSRQRARVVDKQDVSENVKADVAVKAEDSAENSANNSRQLDTIYQEEANESDHSLHHVKTTESIPDHSVSDSLARFSMNREDGLTAAQRRRMQMSRNMSQNAPLREESESEEDERPRGRRQETLRDTRDPPRPMHQLTPTQSHQGNYLEEKETAAERRRRQAALGITNDEDSSSSDEEEGTGFREPKSRTSTTAVAPASSSQAQSSQQQPAQSGAARARQSVQFAEAANNPRSSSGPRLRWGADVKK